MEDSDIASTANSNTQHDEAQVNDTAIESVQGQPDQISKASQRKLAKKMNRKLAQGICGLVRAEKKEATDMISELPTKNLFVFYFGNGDEEDQNVLLNFCSQFGKVEKITLFPGLNYGFIEYDKIESASALFETLVNKLFVDLKFYGKERTCFFQYSKLEYDQLDKFKVLEFPDATTQVTIPGLIVINDFVSKEEEDQLIKYLDSQKWIKLMNRRVQHFGFEFVYGANNVNKTKEIQPLPSTDSEIYKILEDRINDTLRGFYLQGEDAVRVFDHNKLLINEEVKYEELPNYFEKYGSFDQLTANDYQPGQGIPPHVDTHSPFEEVF